MAIFKLTLVLICTVCAVASLFPGSPSACLCKHEHPQRKFCDADVVFLGYVMSMQTNQKMPNNPQTGLIHDVYTMRVRYTYKTHPVINTSVDNRRSTVKLYSPAAFGGPCFALNLQTGSNYVVSGKITHGNIFTDHCRHFQMKWPNLTWQQLRGMRGEYSKGCGCAIGFCIYCKNLLPGCRDFKFQAFDLCRDKYQHCEKRVGPRGETSCAWVNSRKCSAVP